MAHAQLHPVFTDLIKQLQALEAKAGQEGHMPWMRPPGYPGPNFLEWADTCFDRSKINTNYEEVLGGNNKSASTNTDRGSVGDTASLNVQMAFVSAAERAFRLRHMTYARGHKMAQARHDGRGHATGGVFVQIRSAVQAFTRAGSADSTASAEQPAPADGGPGA